MHTLAAKWLIAAGVAVMASLAAVKLGIDASHARVWLPRLAPALGIAFFASYFLSGKAFGEVARFYLIWAMSFVLCSVPFDYAELSKLQDATLIGGFVLALIATPLLVTQGIVAGWMGVSQLIGRRRDP